MLNWDSIIETEWDHALSLYNTYLADDEKASRDARVSIMNAYAISCLSKAEFYDYLHDVFFVWKYTAKNRLATTIKSFEQMKLDDLEKARSELINPSLSDTALLDAALKIRGLGSAGATALLSTLYPSRFATIDQFVIINLQHASSLALNKIIHSINPQSINKKQALYVLALIQQKARDLNALFGKMSWTPRAIDKAVWADR